MEWRGEGVLERVQKGGWVQAKIGMRTAADADNMHAFLGIML